MFVRQRNQAVSTKVVLQAENKDPKSAVKIEREVLELIKCSELQNLTDFESFVAIKSQVFSEVEVDLVEYKNKNLRVDYLLKL